MRHHNSVRKFGREKGERQALMRSLARNLINHGSIETTLAKAKELRPYMEKLVTKAKANDIASKRLLNSRIHGAKEIKKLFTDIAPKYTDRKGGYTRIVRIPNRDLDGSAMAIIQFV
jgi:large subunit ribosomal protein L17